MKTLSRHDYYECVWEYLLEVDEDDQTQTQRYQTQNVADAINVEWQIHVRRKLVYERRFAQIVTLIEICIAPRPVRVTIPSGIFYSDAKYKCRLSFYFSFFVLFFNFVETTYANYRISLLEIH